MEQLVRRLNETSYAYYVLDDPIISDMQWDQMYDELKKLESETGIVLPDSPTKKVGGEPLKSFEEHRHITRLWSLDKVQSLEELEAWIQRTEKLAEAENLQYYLEYKFDGLTLNLTYRDGELVQAATRGNGIVGEAILPQAKTIKVRKHTGIRYESTNVNIATVSRKGVIKAKNKGTCYVYAYAQDGVFRKIKVAVR